MNFSLSYVENLFSRTTSYSNVVVLALARALRGGVPCIEREKDLSGEIITYYLASYFMILKGIVRKQIISSQLAEKLKNGAYL